MTTQVRNSVSFDVPSASVIRADRFVRIDSTGLVEADDPTEVAVGVAEDASAAGETAPISVNQINGSGVLEVEAGGAVAIGELITTDGQGRGVATSTAGNKVYGVAKQAASAAGVVFEMTPIFDEV